MLRVTYLLAALSAVVILTVGCKGNATQAGTPDEVVATIEPGSEASLFPLQKGDQWTYLFREELDGDPQIQRDYVVRVVETSLSGGGRKAVLGVYNDETLVDRQTWFTDRSGLYQLTAGKEDVEFSTPHLVARFPLKQGDTFEWHGKGLTPSTEIGDIDEVTYVRPSEVVDTQYGQLNAIPVETHTKYKGKKFSGESVATIYLKPQIGMVRFKQEINRDNHVITDTLTLKGDSLKTGS